MTEPIVAGGWVEIQDAEGEWHPAVARTSIEPTHRPDPATGRMRKIHDFPVIWVQFTGNNGVRVELPWPAEHVRHWNPRWHVFGPGDFTLPDDPNALVELPTEDRS